ncbi:MAG: restriction endonuclease [Planctomycetaceae bacterium]|nr:restriction endonuclease [Planctomycetaceae bacterium]
MHPDTFEKLIAEIFASNGYLCEWTGRCKHTAADVLAIRKTESLERVKDKPSAIQEE